MQSDEAGIMSAVWRVAERVIAKTCVLHHVDQDPEGLRCFDAVTPESPRG
jgi:hypothetical protein